MISVGRQIGDGLLDRPRADLERRDEYIGRGCGHDPLAGAGNRIAGHLATALGADGPADCGEQQPQVIVNLGDAADRRARVADGVFLAQGERRRDVRDGIDVGALHAVQEQPRVRGKALHVSPLPFRVYSVEDQAGLTRTRNPGYDREAQQRQVEIEVLQIVGAGPADED